MHLKARRYYKTRSGNVVFVAAILTDCRFKTFNFHSQAIGWLMDEEYGADVQGWSLAGRFGSAVNGLPSSLDLIEEIEFEQVAA